ncbi:hypothetical protein NEAUS04_2526 [Nematocida ausubeli]|nr:hypothetical protein NEPAR05_2448 [Nematocida parisii]KAI5165900.1 hypothetical protein NEAUS04_2526 [Nematocida ausubeli]
MELVKFGSYSYSGIGVAEGLVWSGEFGRGRRGLSQAVRAPQVHAEGRLFFLDFRVFSLLCSASLLSSVAGKRKRKRKEGRRERRGEERRAWEEEDSLMQSFLGSAVFAEARFGKAWKGKERRSRKLVEEGI